MSIATTCPSCEALFRLSDTLAGKRVQCQKCMTRFIVPSAGTSETQPGIPVEAVASTASTKASVEAPKPRSKPAPVPAPTEPEEFEEPEEEEERPRKKRRADPEEEEDSNRPRKKRRADPDEDDEDDDDRPRRRRKKSRSSGSNMNLIYILAGVGVLLLVVCGGVGGLFYALSNRGQGGNTAIVLGADGTFRTTSALRIWDPAKDGKHFRTFTLNMEAGRTYEIDMQSRDLDSYLVVLDDTGRVVMEDDDSGGALNARVIITPQRAGIFRIEASTFDDLETGSFTLAIRRR
jgi:predicted Zn finger-like uncharacterized protein